MTGEWQCSLCSSMNDPLYLSCKECFTEHSVQRVRECRNELLDYIHVNREKLVVTADPNAAVICVGDIHGNLSGLKLLFKHLHDELVEEKGEYAFDHAVIVFLGDYVDRGPDSAGVLQYLIDLPTLYPNQTHVYVMGNHDHQFSAFIGILEEPPGGFSELEFADGDEFKENDEVGPEFVKDLLHIHPKGRRYAAKIQKLCGKNGGKDANMTAVSYGCSSGKRDELIPLIPRSHIDFLKQLRYVVMIDIPNHGKLMCLHGGFLTLLPTVPQLKQLIEKDPTLLSIEQMYQMTRDFTIIMPPADLYAINDMTIVTGHHGIQAFDKHLRRVIIDPGDCDGSCGAAVFIPESPELPVTVNSVHPKRKAQLYSPLLFPSVSPFQFLSTSPMTSPSLSSSPASPTSLTPTRLYLSRSPSPTLTAIANSSIGFDVTYDVFPLLSEHLRYFTTHHLSFGAEAERVRNQSQLTQAQPQSHSASSHLRIHTPPAATTTEMCSVLLENSKIVRSSYEEALVYSSLITLMHDLRKVKEEKAKKKQKAKEATKEMGDRVIVTT